MPPPRSLLTAVTGKQIVDVVGRRFDAVRGILAGDFFVVVGDCEPVLGGSGEQQRHATILEASRPPPARDKSGDPGGARGRHLALDERQVVAVISAIGRGIGCVFGPLALRIDVLPMPPFPAHLRIGIPSIIDRQHFASDICSATYVTRRSERRGSDRHREKVPPNCPIF